MDKPQEVKCCPGTIITHADELSSLGTIQGVITSEEEVPLISCNVHEHDHVENVSSNEKSCYLGDRIDHNCDGVGSEDKIRIYPC